MIEEIKKESKLKRILKYAGAGLVVAVIGFGVSGLTGYYYNIGELKTVSSTGLFSDVRTTAIYKKRFSGLEIVSGEAPFLGGLGLSLRDLEKSVIFATVGGSLGLGGGLGIYHRKRKREKSS